MSQHDFNIGNANGRTFRQDINDALAAIASQSSGNTEPDPTYPFQPWVDTSGDFPVLKYRDGANATWIVIGRTDQPNLGMSYFYSGNAEPSPVFPFQPWVDTNGSYPIYKIRNAANSAWITIGRLDQANLGMMPLTGGTFTGPAVWSNTSNITLPRGTTAQRPGSPSNGMFRYNTTLNVFEGYQAGAWGEVGGGGYISKTTQSLAASGTIAISSADQRQIIPIQGNSAPVTLSNTPFGIAGGWKDGAEVFLVGLSDENSVVIKYADIPKGVVGTFSEIEITKWKSVTFIWSSSLDRFIAQGVS